MIFYLLAASNALMALAYVVLDLSLSHWGSVAMFASASVSFVALKLSADLIKAQRNLLEGWSK